MQIWFNNFTDTDCGGPATVNAYLETWYSFLVSPKAEAAIDLPFEHPGSYNIIDPDTMGKSKVWCHRVLCSGKGGNEVPAKAAVAGGREVWVSTHTHTHTQ